MADRLPLASVRHLIWDWNGTLLDDVELCVAVLNHLRAGTTIGPVSAAFYREHFGFPVVRFYARLGFETSAPAFAALSNRFISTYYAWIERSAVHPEARAFAEQWHGRGGRQVLLSASREDHLAAAVERFALGHLFEALAGLGDIYAGGKTSRGQELMAELGWAPARTLLIGDTDHDAEVARALGIGCLLLDRGHQTRSRLERCGALVATSLEEAATRWGLGQALAAPA